MSPLKKDENGNLCQGQDKHLAYCAEGDANPCDPDPEMLLTVTGASGTINWCGQTWNLPADSGVEKSVCPTFYSLGRGTQFQFTFTNTYKEYFAEHQWHHNNSLRLEQNYRIYAWSATWALWNRDGFGPGNKGYIRLQPPAGNRLDLLGVQGNTVPMPRPAYGYILPLSATGQLDMGILSLGMPTWTYNNYGLTNQWFGSHTIGGVTYAWAKGAGWP